MILTFCLIFWYSACVCITYDTKFFGRFFLWPRRSFLPMVPMLPVLLVSLFPLILIRMTVYAMWLLILIGLSIVLPVMFFPGAFSVLSLAMIWFVLSGVIPAALTKNKNLEVFVMQAMLHGFRRIDMVDQRTNRPVKGYSCFISFTSEGVQGVETAKQFISDDLAVSCSWRPEVGKLLSLDFTPRGRVCGISTVREK